MAGHRRRISSEFLNDLKNGILKPVTEMVKNDPELFLGFRTKPSGKKKSGKDEIVDIYYRGHVIFEIKKQESPKDCYGCAFDFNHARYTAKYEDVLHELQKLGMQLPRPKGQVKPNMDVVKPTRSRVNLLSWTIGARKTSSDFPWEKVKNMFERLMDDYMNPNKAYNRDYFAEKFNSPQHKKRLYIEKQHEQRLALTNQTLDRDDCFFVYDMEYTEPEVSSPDEEINSFDLLAFHVKNGCAKEWYILEVKSTEAALDGDSGMQTHFRDMDAYVKSDLVKARLDDAKGILADYQELFGTVCPTFSADIQPLYGFVMTGEVDQCAENFAKEFPGVPFFIPNRNDKSNFVLDVNDVCFVPKELP